MIKENFAPTSADDLNEQHRKSEVLVSALEKCEKLEKQLKIAVECLEEYADCKNWSNEYDIDSPDMTPLWLARRWKEEKGYKLAFNTLKQIKELDNAK